MPVHRQWEDRGDEWWNRPPWWQQPGGHNPGGNNPGGNNPGGNNPGGNNPGGNNPGGNNPGGNNPGGNNPGGNNPGGNNPGGNNPGGNNPGGNNPGGNNPGGNNPGGNNPGGNNPGTAPITHYALKLRSISYISSETPDLNRTLSLSLNGDELWSGSAGAGNVPNIGQPILLGNISPREFTSTAPLTLTENRPTGNPVSKSTTNNVSTSQDDRGSFDLNYNMAGGEIYGVNLDIVHQDTFGNWV
ncbi:hypothetical protein [Rhodovastum atsumiense]|uniref:hypothetical protein n=1 Tax=Rhodovastum atsumiense TaxID=504468 RepID=UPI0020258162|nr:hypothetical protein [Rhodovastum atsumiense]